MVSPLIVVIDEGMDVRLEIADQLATHDGILFDTYPLSQDEYERNEVSGTAYTHAAEFFGLAQSKLRKGGVFTYLSREVDSLSCCISAR